MISVLILTKNEEFHISACLASVSWCRDIHVFDSLSTDKTVDLARSAGAKVTQRTFDGFASQRNAALSTLAFANDWVLILDADERVPVALATELLQFVRGADAAVAAARMRRRDFFMTTWLKHAQLSPYYIRLIRPSKVRYEREINEVLMVDGAIVDLQQPFDHHPFLQGLTHWFAKHNLYSSMEAQLALASRRGQSPYSLRKALTSSDFNERRVHQKELFYRLPFRPLIKWVYMMFVRLAFLDGKAGIAYVFLQTFYEYMIVLKTAELSRRTPPH